MVKITQAVAWKSDAQSTRRFTLPGPYLTWPPEPKYREAESWHPAPGLEKHAGSCNAWEELRTTETLGGEATR